MPTKTISVDLEAYDALRRRKKPGQSFSDVIKEHFAGRTTGAMLLRAIDEITVEEDTLDTLDEIVAGREASEARAPEL